MVNQKPSRIKNLGIAGISALTGCVSLIVVLGALFIGLWLDRVVFGQRGPATICTLVASVPVSLFLMIRIALALVQKIGPPAQAVQSQRQEKEE
jgi:predicted permease